MTDCLILGFYEYPFAQYVDNMQLLGEQSGAYRDLSLAFIEYDGKPKRALDVLSDIFYADKPVPPRPLNNADFLFPVITYLVTYLAKRQLEVEYISHPHYEMKMLEDRLRKGDVRTVAITTTLYVSPLPIIELLSAVRRFGPKVKIILGGPYISNQSKSSSRKQLTQLLKFLGADIYILCAEGEATLADTLRALRTNGALEFIPNLAIRRRDEILYTAERSESNSLANEPVDYKLFAPSELGEFISTRTAKSCPFACSFCGFPARAGKYTVLGVEEVERELDAIAERGTVTTLSIIDDTFNVPKARFKSILSMMSRRKYPFKWNCFYRADHGDETVIDMMAEAGCEGVFLGIESGSDAMLERMNKTARRVDYLRAIPAFNRAGISTYASLIVGFPGETADTIQETIDLIETTEPEFYRAQLWYADPVTPVWHDRERLGITGEGFDWSHRTMDAQVASDWIETMFFRIANSTWLPQYGFEQWSTFYLQRKGMSRPQIRAFVENFNSVIKHRLVSCGDPVAPDLLESLRATCRFDRCSPQQHQPAASKWSGKVYQEACEAFAAELGDGEETVAPDLKNPLRGASINARRPICPTLYEWFDPSQASIGDIFLASFAAVVGVTRGCRKLLVDWGDGENVPMPVRFRTSTQEPLMSWIIEAQRKLELWAKYGHFGMAILQDRGELKKYGIEGDPFRYAFRIERDGAVSPPRWFTHREANKPVELVTVSISSEGVSVGQFCRSGDVGGQARDPIELMVLLMQQSKMDRLRPVFDILKSKLDALSVQS